MSRIVIAAKYVWAAAQGDMLMEEEEDSNEKDIEEYTNP